MQDQLNQVISPDYFSYLLDVEGSLAFRHLNYLALLEFEFDQLANSQDVPGMIRLIQKGLRVTDVMGRSGGRRFCVILHYTEAGDVYRVAERIRKAVRTWVFSLEKRDMWQTVSIGGACFPTHSSTIERLVGVCAEMLSKAKSDGGDRIYLPEE